MSPRSPAIPTFCCYLQKVRRTWIAARDDDERKRLLKEDEGLAVKQLPKAAPELMRRYGFFKTTPTRSISELNVEGNKANFEVGTYALLAPSVHRTAPITL